MKNVKRYFVLALLLGATACSDFLQEDMEGTYSNASFYKTESHALLAVNGIYNTVSFVSSDNALWVFGDVVSDDATKGGLAGDQSDIQFLEEFNYSANNGYTEKIWKRYYEGITRANYLLYYADGIEMDETLKARVVGEAKFLRAYLYFNLVNIFGPVPLKKTPPITDNDINVPVSPVAGIYAAIEQDLTEASQVLAESYTGSDLGRATRGAALGLLA